MRAERRRHLRVDGRQVRWIDGQDGVKRFKYVRLAERVLPAEHLVERHAERKEIGASIDLLALHLLRRHVAGCAEDDAGDRARAPAVSAFERHLELCQAEVEDLHDRHRTLRNMFSGFRSR